MQWRNMHIKTARTDTHRLQTNITDKNYVKRNNATSHTGVWFVAFHQTFPTLGKINH